MNKNYTEEKKYCSMCSSWVLFLARTFALVALKHSNIQFVLETERKLAFECEFLTLFYSFFECQSNEFKDFIPFKFHSDERWFSLYWIRSRLHRIKALLMIWTDNLEEMQVVELIVVNLNRVNSTSSSCYRYNTQLRSIYFIISPFQAKYSMKIQVLNNYAEILFFLRFDILIIPPLQGGLRNIR